MPEITYKHFNVLLTKAIKNILRKLILNRLILQPITQWGKKIHAEVSLWGKNSENTDSFEKRQKNREIMAPGKILYFLNKLKYLRAISWSFFFPVKYVVIWELEGNGCVAGGFNQLDKVYDFIPVGLGQLNQNRKVCLQNNQWVMRNTQFCFQFLINLKQINEIMTK